MSPGRFVVLGLAPARSAWFDSVGLWATTGALPVEFIKCLSPEEVRVRLRSGRAHSALLVDARLPGADRELLGCAANVRCAVIVVNSDRGPHDWIAMGASLTLSATFGQDDLQTALNATAEPIGSNEARTQAPAIFPGQADAQNRRSGISHVEPKQMAGAAGSLVALTGPGGTGTSMAAMALAQALGQQAAASRNDDGQLAVLLADLRRHPELSMLHRVDEAGPGIAELVDSHRRGWPTPETVRALGIPSNRPGYCLLGGLRRASHWTTIRPETFKATLDSLLGSYSTVICDIECDFEGEADGGSLDVEERNTMARQAALRATVAMAVGGSTIKGIHAVVRVVADLVELGVDPARIITVLNHAPRSPRDRATLAVTTTELVSTATGTPPGGLVFLPERSVEPSLRSGTPLPPELGSILAGALVAVRRRLPDDGEPPEVVPQPVRAGSLGIWASA